MAFSFNLIINIMLIIGAYKVSSLFLRPSFVLGHFVLNFSHPKNLTVWPVLSPSKKRKTRQAAKDTLQFIFIRMQDGTFDYHVSTSILIRVVQLQIMYRHTFVVRKQITILLSNINFQRLPVLRP